MKFTGRVVDAKNKNPIPYASIMYGDNLGVVADKDGKFVIETKGFPGMLAISSAGYEEKQTPFNPGGLYTLEAKVIDLPGVVLKSKPRTKQPAPGAPEKSGNAMNYFLIVAAAIVFYIVYLNYKKQ